MKRLIKIILWLIALLVVLLIVAAIALPIFFDPNDYREDIEEAVTAKTGRDFKIEGPIEWSVFPWVGIEMGPIRLANASGFGDEPMARIASIGASVKVMPLLRKQVEIGTVSLDGLNLNLGIDAAGRSNWESILEAMEQEAPAEPDAADDSGGAVDLESLVISEVNVADSAVYWSDQQAGQNAELTGFNLSAENIELGKPFDLASRFDLRVDDPELSGATTFSANVASDEAGSRFELNDVQLSFDGNLQGEPPTPLDLDVRGAAALDIEAGTGKLSQWRVELFNLVLLGDFDLAGLNDVTKVSGKLELQTFSPRELMTSLGAEVPDSADPNVLSKASATMALSSAPGDLRLTDVKFVLDDTTLSGTAGIKGEDKPQLQFDLAVDAIDLDRYLPATAVESTESAEESAPLSVETFRDIYADGRFRVQSLKVSGLSAKNVDVRVRGNGQSIRLNPLTADFYEGRYSGDIRVDATGARPMLSLNETVSGVQALPLLSDLQEDDPSLEGTGNFNMRLATDLSTSQSIMEGLNGNLGFEFLDGAIRGINIAQRIRQAKASITGKTLAVAEDQQKTDFSEFRATAKVTNGVVSNDDLFLASPLLRTVGQGTVDLAKGELDYTIKPVLVKSLEGQGSGDLDDLSGIPIPIRLTGPLTEPQWKVDVAAAIKESQKAKIDEKKDELKDRLFDKLRGDDGEDEGGEGEKSNEEEAPKSSSDKRRDLLRGLLDRDDDDDDDSDSGTP